MSKGSYRRPGNLVEEVMRYKQRLMMVGSDPINKGVAVKFQASPGSEPADKSLGGIHADNGEILGKILQIQI